MFALGADVLRACGQAAFSVGVVEDEADQDAAVEDELDGEADEGGDVFRLATADLQSCLNDGLECVCDRVGEAEQIDQADAEQHDLGDVVSWAWPDL